jgi:aminopeptidase N
MHEEDVMFGGGATGENAGEDVDEKGLALNGDTKLNDVRLNSIVTPRHYDLKFTTIDLVKHTFEGVVTIDLDATAEGQDSITLHALELNIIDAKLFETKQAFSETNLVDDSLPAGIYETIANYTSANETVGTDVTEHPLLDNPAEKQHCYQGEEFLYNVRQQTCTIKFAKPSTLNSFLAKLPIIRPGTSYQLELTFAGVLNDQMCGLYRSTYTSMDGETECTMASTHFEATSARRAFPCFDEPALKATFQLTATVPLQSPQTGRPLRCISNTPIAEEHTRVERNEEGSVPTILKTYKFDITPKMSSYLVALVVGEFDSICATSAKTGIRTTIYTVPGKAHMAQFCLEVASKCLDLFSDLFDVPYPLQKSDLIAIPDFAAGAMENWGCVTYREAKVSRS